MASGTNGTKRDRWGRWKVAWAIVILLSGAINTVLGCVLVATWLIDRISWTVTDILARWSGW